MSTAYAAGRYARFLWDSATWRDRAVTLVILLLSGLTLTSLMFSTSLEIINRLIWMLAFGVLAWGQIGTVIDRVVQAALTEEFVAQVTAETTAFGETSVGFDFADMRHVFVGGHGWVKADRR